MLTAAFGDHAGTVAGLTVAANGTGRDLVAVGHTAAGGTSAPALSRIDAGGRLQHGFGERGVCVLRPDDPARLVGVGVRPHGDLVAVGTAGRGSGRRLMVAEVGVDGRPSADAGADRLLGGGPRTSRCPPC